MALSLFNMLTSRLFSIHSRQPTGEASSQDSQRASQRPSRARRLCLREPRNLDLHWIVDRTVRSQWRKIWSQAQRSWKIGLADLAFSLLESSVEYPQQGQLGVVLAHELDLWTFDYPILMGRRLRRRCGFGQRCKRISYPCCSYSISCK